MTWRLTSIKRIAALLMVAGVLIFSTKASGMLKVCLFSPVKGVVVLKGQPVVGAIVERSYDWAWKNQKGRDETTTGEDGEFSLPAIYGTMILGSVLPHDPSIDQTILIRCDGKSYQAWWTDKRNYEEFGELSISKSLGESPGLRGGPINLYCELTAELKNRGGYGGVAELR